MIVSLRGPKRAETLGANTSSRLGVLVRGGKRIAIPSSGLTLGNAESDDVQLGTVGGEPISGWIVRNRTGEYEYVDAGAAATVNGQPVGREQRVLVAGDVIEIAGEALRFEFGSRPGVTVTDPAPNLPPLSLTPTRQRIVLGRTEQTDVTLQHPSISRRHAEIVAGADGTYIRDLATSGGTLLNGRLVTDAPIERGDEIGIGPYRLTFDGEGLVESRPGEQGMLLQSHGVAVDVPGRTILQPTWLTIEPGEFVAIVGESGAGKTTLMKCLAGVTEPTVGRVLADGEDIALRQLEIGYVPQDDIVHRQLTVREALGYAAALRLPPDSTADDRAVVVERVIAEVELEHHAETMVGALSGGQRKRVNVASELVDRPGLLFLDEPTTGLDPALERRMMELLRALADRERTVLLVTHATRSLRLCDRLIVIARGGYVAFSGSPEDALGFFGVEHPDDIYEALEYRSPSAWQSRFLASPYNDQDWSAPSPVPQRASRAGVPKRSAARQIRPLIGRHLKVFLRDRRNLTIIAVQCVLLGLITALLFRSGVFNRVPRGQRAQPGVLHVGESAQLLFLLVTVAIWFGAIAAAREIVKERSVLTREIAVGVRVRAYLFSKLLPICAVVGIQTLVLVVIALALRPLQQAAGGQLALLLVVTSWVGVAMGLAISASVRSEDQATSFIPLALIPQLLFGGAIVPIAQMAGVMQVISAVFFARWSFAASGSLLDLNDRIASDPTFSKVSRYGTDFFVVGLGEGIVILTGFAAAFVAFCAWRIVRTTRYGSV